MDELPFFELKNKLTFMITKPMEETAKMQEHSLENDFYRWLSGQVSPVQLSNMYTAFSGINSFCLSRKILQAPLFQTTDKAILTKVRDTVERNQVFCFTYKKQRTIMAQAIRRYIAYIDHLKTTTIDDGFDSLNSTEAPATSSDDPLIQLMVEENIQFIDFRSKGGCLWMIGGFELQKVADHCKSIGVNFTWKAEGSLVTDGKAAWWTKDAASNMILSAKLNDDKDIKEFLAEEPFGPLREMLIKQGITTVSGLRDVKLWVFMNRYNLYTIATRQEVFSRVQHMLQSQGSAEKKATYKLSFLGEIISGATPSQVFLQLCEEIAKRYPLKFRTFIGVPVSTGGLIVLNKRDHGNCLQMENPIAFIDANMSKQDALDSAAWICKKCMGFVPKLAITEGIPEQDVSAPFDESEKLVDSTKKTNANEEPVELEFEEKSSELEKLPVPTQLQKLQLDRMYQLVLDADLNGIAFDNLKEALNITMAAVKELVRIAPCLLDIKGRVYHEDVFVDWDEGADALDTILDKLMQRNSGYVSAVQLYEYAHVEMRMFLNDNDMDDERSVYEMAQHLFEYGHYKSKIYVFTGKMHISKPAAAIGNNFDIFCKYADDQGGVFSYTSLVDYLSGIGIKTRNLRTQLRLQSEARFFYYAEGILLASSKMYINESWKATMNAALSKLFADVGDHIILRNIRDMWFEQLPSLPSGLTWTPLLLQSVLRFYGKDFNARTIIAMDTQSIETVHSMLVQLDSPIQNFGDAVISYLLESEISCRTFEAEELRSILVESKMIQGNELIYNMPKALGNDTRFSWDVTESHVTILV